MTKSYSELQRLASFEDRFEYLCLSGVVGEATFGFDRQVNQNFYRSHEWRSARDYVIVRDNGCDLGIPGMEIQTELLVHHMNPMNVDDILHGESWILDPEYLITTTIQTHNDIHYSGKLSRPTYVERTPGDTKLW